MIKKLLTILSLIGVILFSIQSTFALQTYVGVKILNLTDDPSASCVGQYAVGVDPYQQGRIRAISSIQPSYPIYFSLTYASNGTIVWQGNDTADQDYIIGDVIYLPNTIDMQTGVDYNLFIDIDAIKIYLPLEDNYDSPYNIFQATINDNYWVIGLFETHTLTRTADDSSNNNCNSPQIWSGSPTSYSVLKIYGFRNLTNNWLPTKSIWGYRIGKIGNKYDNLYQSNVGNINFAFTFN